ncbi:MAG: hydroxyacid dehydrogenase [Gammaproteobacteria bacterium]|nr:hydroxyacid dehydrogenase [Gammaproteobacteria bacterium]
MTKVTFFDVVEETHVPLRKALRDHPAWDARLVTDPLHEQNAVLAQDSEVVSAFGTSRVTAGVLDKLPALRLIATRSTGHDHIDLAGAAARNVRVCNVPGYSEDTVAEYTLGLLIALMRRLPATLRRCYHGDFSRIGLTGSDLRGKTLGLLGTGRIGARVARLAHAFGMRLLACDPRPDETLRREYGMTYLALEDLLPQVDALSLHLPYSEATHHLLNAERLGALKPGVVLVNTARGGIVDSRALARLQAEGHFGGLALDCFEGEEIWLSALAPLPRHFSPTQVDQALNNFRLQLGDNAILTPHNAFNSAEALQRGIDVTLENIQAFFAGNPKNLVTPV